MDLKSLCFVILLLLLLGVSCVDAGEVDDNITLTQEDTDLELSEDSLKSDVVSSLDDSGDCPESDVVDAVSNLNASDESLESEVDEIIVSDWDELQYYCSLTDKDYTLRLKENTVFYPSDFDDVNKQIKINNNVKIIGSQGSYIGDVAPIVGTYEDNMDRYVKYALIVVPENNGCGMNVVNVTFKWVHTLNTNAGLVMDLAGNREYEFDNCIFDGIQSMAGSASIMHVRKGKAILNNCSIINCTVAKGCINVYSRQSVILRDCYFAYNYGYEHSTCVMNWGKLLIYNTKFYKNRSQAWAGGITTYGEGNTTIYDSNFTDNVAGWNGGALYVYNIVNIYNTVFVGNNCTTNNGGGAIGACQYSGIPRLYVDGCLFKDNNNNCWALDELSTTGTGRGGAISFMDVGSIDIRNSLFIANSASIGTAICAWEAGSYGSPDIYITNNTFINHTRAGDVLNVKVIGTACKISGNQYVGNSIEFSNLNLTTVNVGNDKATLNIAVKLVHPSFYESDILDRTLYDVYVNGRYAKTVNSTVFDLEFGDLDICNVYVIPTISNVKSNELTLTSTREYIFVSRSSGDDNNNGSSRSSPVRSIGKAVELARYCHNIILLDGDFSENIVLNYDLTLKGENDAKLTNLTLFKNNAVLSLKNLEISNLSGNLIAGGNVSLSNCIVQNNQKEVVFNASNIEISNSIILDNLNVAVCDYINVKDSILLNNINLVDAKSYDLDGNWWGSTLENYQIQPYNDIDAWLVLNATGDTCDLEINQMATVNVGFYMFKNSTSTKYNFRDIELSVMQVNGSSVNSTLSNSNVYFMLTALGDGELTFSYESVLTSVRFNFIKSNPNIHVSNDNIMFGDDLIVKVNLPNDLSGNVTVKVSNFTQTQSADGILLFNFTRLKANDYVITVVYSGDEKYLDKIIQSQVKVSKYESFTLLTIGEIVVDDDLLLTVTAPSDSKGNVTITVNDNTITLPLNDSKANYTIKNIRRGDYRITAVYNGDDKYLTSRDYRFIEVDNLVSSMSVHVGDIVYGGAVIVEVILNDNATGNLTAAIGKITNSSIVKDGRANITLLGVEAGFKEVNVFYSGDDTYFNRTESASFTISKADLTFEISSADIMIGQDAVIFIKVPAKTTGNFTINGDIIAIPLSGTISYIIPDLEIGDYDLTAVYQGNNYNTVSNSTSFSVLEYPKDQWPNSGFDAKNTGKSPYASSSNGEILFTIPVNETIVGDVLIDNEGNIYFSTVDAVYSFTCDGVLRWNFTDRDVIGNFSGISMSREVVVVPKSGDTLFFINQKTGEKYGSSNFYQGSSIFSPIMDDKANIYVSSEYQVTSGSYKLVIIPFGLWEFGGTPTMLDLGKNAPLTSPVIGEDIVVVLTDSRLWVIDAKTLKTRFIKSGDYGAVRPVVNENIVYAVLGDCVVAYSLTGSQLWKTKLTGGAGNQLLLDCEFLYATNSRGNLYRYDLSNGKEYLVSSLNVTSGVLIGLNDNLYFGCDNFFYEITSGGDVLWKSDLESKITGSPVMDNNGVIYVTSEDNKVFALSKSALKNIDLDVKVSSTIQGEDTVITINLDGQVTGSVSFAVNGVNYNEAIADGVVVKVIPNLPAGSYDVNVTYNGDLRFNKASKTVTFAVKPAQNPVLKGSDITVLYTSNSYYKVKLTQNSAPLADKTLTISFNGVNYNVKTNSKGIASFKIAAKPGKYTIKASYNGKVTKNTVTVKSIINAKNINAKKSAKTVKIKVTLSKVNKKYLKNKAVTLKFNKKTFNAKTNSKGVVTFTIKNSIYKKLKAGKKYTYQVIYGKDNVKKTIKFK
ncbi:PQQ-binding-like beta-propeller repeat protein [uncultured Methanobrevibacter sp.]|uniref:outer membrane protein assembly factor BamB family protein n=1 Tax=uncultured Methanobrevibacter sp. TaxID=253161 RepID=UPI0026102621|nr:Ig-like domain repeat protein [uncultured Methanobrevibacter sp.]